MRVLAITSIVLCIYCQALAYNNSTNATNVDNATEAYIPTDVVWPAPKNDNDKPWYKSWLDVMTNPLTYIKIK